MAAYNIHELLPKVRERAERDLGRAIAADELSAITLATIRELDMHVAGTGEVVDPRPNKTFMPPQQNVRLRGRRY